MKGLVSKKPKSDRRSSKYLAATLLIAMITVMSLVASIFAPFFALF